MRNYTQLGLNLRDKFCDEIEPIANKIESIFLRCEFQCTTTVVQFHAIGERH